MNFSKCISFLSYSFLQVNYTAMDMIRAQATPAPAAGGAVAAGAPSMGMVSAAASKVPAAMLSGIDALERSAEQEAWQRSSAAAGEKRKFAANDEEAEEEEPPRKGVRDSDEIDI